MFNLPLASASGLSLKNSEALAQSNKCSFHMALDQSKCSAKAKKNEKKYVPLAEASGKL